MTEWPDTETLLASLRQWIDRTRAEAELAVGEGHAGDEPGGPPNSTGPRPADPVSVGLVQVVEEFTALRHELKLQTKSARGLEEQTGQALTGLEEAIAEFRGAEADEQEAAKRAAEPLVHGLVELDEALERGRMAVESARVHAEQSASDLQRQLDELAERQPGWKRWLCRRWRRAVEEACARHAREALRPVFDSLAEGYSLIQGRLRRAMAQQEIERMECVGQPVDPHAMTVVEAVDDPSRPSGTVAEEIRRGYYWRGEVLRYAEVRAVR
jgi:molecular chaperone GrpE